MSSQKRHVDIPSLPIEEDWRDVYDALLRSVEKAKVTVPAMKDLCPSFGDLVDMVLFLLSKVGVKTIDSLHNLEHHLKELYNQNLDSDFYPDDIFVDAWTEGSDSAGGSASPAESYFFWGDIRNFTRPRRRMHKEFYLASYVEQVSYSLYYFKGRNKKYLPMVLRVAQDLLYALYHCKGC